MAVFTLGFEQLSGAQPQYTFTGAADLDGFDPRGGAMWSILGPAVTGTGDPSFSAPETHWYLFGAGFDTDPLQPLPSAGTITALYHVEKLDGAAPPATPDDLFVNRVFAQVTGLSVAAADFAAAVAGGTVAGLLTAGDDLFRGPSTLTPFIPVPVTVSLGTGNDTLFGSGRGDQVEGQDGDDVVTLRDEGTVVAGDGSTV